MNKQVEKGKESIVQEQQVEGDLLSKILEEGKLARNQSQVAIAKDMIGEFVQQAMEGQLVMSRDVEATINARIAEIDRLISVQLNEIMHQEEFQKYVKMDMIEQILPVLDNFDASLEHVPENQKKSSWVIGINHIRKQLFEILKSINIEEIETKRGDKFNPEIHEAVAGKGEKHEISKIIQKGYQMNGKVLRATRVEVE